MGQAGSSSPKISKNDQVILKLKVQRDSLLKYNSRLGVLINSDLNNAKLQLAQGNKSQSIRYLRLKKRHEEILDKTLSQIDSLEQMVSNIEDKLLEKQFLSKLTEGNEILKVLNRECSASKVDKILDDTIDNIETTNQISDAMGNGIKVDIDDDDIEEELTLLQSAINKENEKKNAIGSGIVGQLPSIETDKPIFPKTSKDEIHNSQEIEANRKTSETSHEKTEAILSV